MPCLEYYITKGIKKAESENPATRVLVRMPIIPTILLALKKEWEKSPDTEDTIVMWAACTLALFFRFSLNRGNDSPGLVKL